MHAAAPASFSCRRFAAPRALCALSVLALASSAAAQQPSFTPLPLAPETGSFGPAGISANGSIVGGMAYVLGLGDKARRWRAGLGFDNPAPDASGTASWCSAVSASGSVLVGGSGHAVFGDLEGWMRIGTSTGHVGSPSGHDTSSLEGVSDDGLIAVGYGGHQSNPNLFQAARYSEANDWSLLGFLSGGTNSKALGTNANGSVIVGWSDDALTYGRHAFRWTAAGGMQKLPHLPNGDDQTARDTNGDGSVVVGDDYVVNPDFSSTQRAWRWTQAGGTQPLGELEAGGTSGATAVSADGQVVVGWASANGGTTAFVWDAAHGMRALRDVLHAQGVGAVDGWELASADAIAGNGTDYWIAGSGASANLYGGWEAHVPSLIPAAHVASVGAGCGQAAPWLSSSLPVLGQPITLLLGAGVPGAPTAFFYSGLPAPGLALGGGCTAYLALASLAHTPFALASGAGGASYSFSLPMLAANAGLELAVQALQLPTAGALGFDLSNGLVLSFGY